MAFSTPFFSIAALASSLLAPFTLQDDVYEEPLIEPLSPLSFLVGRCWAGTFPDTDILDVHCYESAFRGTVVIDRQVVEDNPVFCGATFFHFAQPQFEDEKEGVILFRNYNLTGGVSDGLIEAKGKTLEFPEEIFRGENGQEVKFRTRIQPRSNISYEVVTQQQRGGVWETRQRVLYKAFDIETYPYPDGFELCAE